MAYALKYGNSEFVVALADEQIKQVLEANPVRLVPGTPRELIEDALNHPVGSDRIENIVQSGEKVCVIISDSTRSWQNPGLILEALLDRLAAAGVKDEDIVIISARGSHRAQTDQELRFLVTDRIYNRIKVVDHNCLDENNLTYMGTTSRGTPVKLNSVAVSSDRVILIGAVLHHFLGGFSGGRKSIIPGIASRETIQANHSLSLNHGIGSGCNQLVKSGQLEENPLHLDMLEGSLMLNPCFIINIVVDDNYKMLKAFAGDMVKAHEQACRLVDRMNTVDIDRRYPVVIASAGGYPKDMNVYQPMKTLCHMLECIEPGGMMIMLSQCREGFGSAETEKQITDYDNMLEREKALRDNYSIGAHTGYLYADTAEKFTFILVTDFDATNFSKTKMHIVRTLDEALELAATLHGGSLNEDVCLMPNGSVTLPRLIKKD
ncbi:MAG: nickel-dependent lactate racemase [Thermoclostridium sp.]|nr:nickel-dependent lactate racemase [Thermoclostridium sp.]